MVHRRFDDSAFPLVVAHRGASATHPENTLEAFEAALTAGADAVELDVRVTADGVPVVLHDADVSRTTDGGGRVHELTLADLKRLNAGRPDGPRAEVPALRDALEMIGGRAGVNLEIKNLPGEAGFEPDRERALEAALAELHRTGFMGPVVVSSFNPVTIARSRVLAPDVPTGLLTSGDVDPDAALARALEDGHAFVLPEVGALTAAGRGFLERAHGAGARVGTWTVDDAETLALLFRWGVDAVATNDPATALAVRAGA